VWLATPGRQRIRSDGGSSARRGQKVTADPIRLISNTSADADHLGGNERIAGEGDTINPNAFNAGAQNAAVLAHENVLNRVSAPREVRHQREAGDELMGVHDEAGQTTPGFIATRLCGASNISSRTGVCI
jgi:hypothetical protein